ncbi:MAG TPA: tetratricopeptide repeat protein [Pyrinomonadaceae bacterium]|nr:tetratricopeptide repeat protein [Pyrinomonadaceae bacterium]
MRISAIIRRGVLGLTVLLLVGTGLGYRVAAQNVGGDIGGGIFRPKNPETKRNSGKTPKPITKPTRNPKRNPAAELETKIEDLLDKGNDARDAKKYDDAQAAYEEVLKLKANDERAAYGLGNIYTDQRRWDDAEKNYRNAVTWGPKNVDALVALSVVLVQPLPGANNAKRFSEAELFARRAVGLDPKNAVAWDRLGVALQSRGVFNNDTEQAYRRAVELDPNFAAAYAHLARALRKMNRGDEGAPLYDQAIELAKDPATLVLIAESLQSEQQWDKAEPVLRKALEMDQRSPTTLYLLGRNLIVLKRHQEAEGYLRTAVELSPQAFQPYTLLGQTYLAMNRLEDAEKTYNSAVDVATPGEQKQLAGAYGFEGVGDGYMKAKKKSDAARAYKRALDLDPGNQLLMKKLSQAK